MEAYERGSHTVWECKCHLVWVTKYRYPIPGGDVGIRRPHLFCRKGRDAILGLFELISAHWPQEPSQEQHTEHGRVEKGQLVDAGLFEKGGWATFPGMTSPERGVAQACSDLLTALK